MSDRTLIERVKSILEDIDERRVVLELDPRPFEDWYCETPVFKASGWTFKVFDDCLSWDYLESVTTPEGERLEWPCDGRKMTELERVLHLYYPKHEEDWGYK